MISLRVLQFNLAVCLVQVEFMIHFQIKLVCHCSSVWTSFLGSNYFSYKLWSWFRLFLDWYLRNEKLMLHNIAAVLDILIDWLTIRQYFCYELWMWEIELLLHYNQHLLNNILFFFSADINLSEYERWSRYTQYFDTRSQVRKLIFFLHHFSLIKVFTSVCQSCI